jgi:hypothetical protein
MARAKRSTSQPQKQSQQKRCVICSEMFVPRDARQKTCGKPECQAKIKAEWFAAYRPTQRVKRDPAICKFCGDTFIPYGKRSEHCGKPECKTKFESRQARIRREAKKTLRPAKPQRLCEFCQQMYTPRKRDQKTCGKRECQEKLWQKNRKIKYKATKAEQNKKSRDYYVRQKQLAWRPSDWSEKPEGYRVIGGLLLSASAPLGNAQICTIIDTLKMHCPYADSWTASLKKPECIKYLSRIRNWVRRPGKQGAVNPAANLEQ